MISQSSLLICRSSFWDVFVLHERARIMLLVTINLVVRRERFKEALSQIDQEESTEDGCRKCFLIDPLRRFVTTSIHLNYRQGS